MYHALIKKLFVLLLVSAGIFPAFAAGASGADEYPNWLLTVYKAQERFSIKRQLEKYFRADDADWYARRNKRIAAYIKTCYDAFIDAPDRGLYPFIKARRELLQLAADRGGLFAPYAVVAARPQDLAQLEKESVRFLESVLRLDFDVNPDASGVFYEDGGTVYVEYENLSAQDTLVRLTFDTDRKTIDICRNVCPRPRKVQK